MKETKEKPFFAAESGNFHFFKTKRAAWLLCLMLAPAMTHAAGQITLTPPPNRTVEWGAAWSFSRPTATTTCPGNSTVTIRVLSTATNFTGCGEAYTAARTWSATDACGNSNTCSQVVTVQDTSPPTVYYVPSKQVEIGSAWTFDEPMAVEECIFYSLVYDNSLNDLVTRFNPGANEVGDEIILDGTARYLTTFTLEYWGACAGTAFAGPVNARLRFYRNDGPAFNGYATPGAVLFDSGNFAISPTARATLTFNDFVTGATVPLTGPLPNSFTWSIQFSGMQGQDQAGIDLFSPPIVGQDYPDYWERTSGAWQLKQGGVAMDFTALAYASQSSGVITMSVLSTTNYVGCGGSYTAIRAWQASDACNNATNFSETVSVLDTTPPALTCAGPKTVLGPLPWNFDPPATSDQAVFDTLSLIIYDDSANDLVTRFNPGANEVGDEIILGGTARYLSRFTLEYWGASANGNTFQGPVTARLRFYRNNGPAFNGYATPGAVLYDSGNFAVNPTARATLTFNDFVTDAIVPLTGPLPNSFTWSLQFSGMQGQDQAGIDLFSPAVVGIDYPDYWERVDNNWELKASSDSVPLDFAALAYASQVAVTVVSTVTNFDICPGYTATRAWLAADPCGNTSTCSQTVTVQELPGAISLTVERQDQSVVISWPITSCNYTLQQTTSLNTPNWVAAVGQSRIINNRHVFVTDATGPMRYFRLIKQ